MPVGIRRVFIDSNILLYAVNPRLAEHQRARDALSRLWAEGSELVLSTQVLTEFLTVTTGKLRSHGTTRAVQALDEILPNLTVLPQTDATYAALRELLVKYPVEGVRIFDANIVATMLVHGVTELLTNNTRDFRQSDEISLRSLDYGAT